MAMGAMADLAEGGMMLPAQYVSKMQDSLGRLPDKDDILKFFEAGLGRKDGKLEIRIYIDPAHEKPLLDAAEFNGFMKPDGSGPDPERYYQQIVNWSWDNGAFHQELPGTRRILMLPGNYEEMRELCGGDFESGTDFCRLMKAKHKVDEVDVFELLQPKGR